MPVLRPRVMDLLTSLADPEPGPYHHSSTPWTVSKPRYTYVVEPGSKPFIRPSSPQESMLRPPRPAPSPWQLFFTNFIQRAQANPTKKLNVAQAAKEAGQEYASLSIAEKEKYKRMSQAAKDARERELVSKDFDRGGTYRNRIRHLEEAKRDLNAFEKAYRRADRDVRDREGRTEREKRALRDEIRRLKLASLKVAQEIEALEKPAEKTVNGITPISLPSSVTDGRRVKLEEDFLRDRNRDHSVPTHDFMELFEGAIVDHVTTQCHDKEQLLEKAKRDLEVFKRAYYSAEREIHNLGERFEWEKQALSDEIHRLKEHEAHCREGRFESTIVYQVTQCQCQGQLLDEARRDLEALKKAQYKAERDMLHLKERFEREMGAANHEIRHLRAVVAQEKRVVNQQIPSAVPADTRRYAAVREGTKTA